MQLAWLQRSVQTFIHSFIHGAGHLRCQSGVECDPIYVSIKVVETAALDVLAMEVGSAIEEALLPLRMQACDLNVRDPVAVLKDVDAALERVYIEQGYSRSAIKRYLKAKVYLSLADGHFHPNRKALRSHLGQDGQRLRRKLVKGFAYAKMCMIKA